MPKSFGTRVEALERTDLSGPAGGTGHFVLAMREARLCAAAGGGAEGCPPEAPITAEMMEDPVHGEFCRRLFEARERVRLLRQ